jgi:hypothetical protein
LTAASIADTPSFMKTFVGRCFIAFALLAAAGVAFAGEFKSKIVTGTSSPLVITVPEDRFLKITNFTQEGGVDRGVVTVTLQGDTETTEAVTVLAATRIDLSTGSAAQNPPETIARIVVAGPATVRVRPVAGATLFISYRKEPNDGFGGGGGGGGSPTPFPIFSPTPTCSPGPPFLTPCPTP